MTKPPPGCQVRPIREADIEAFWRLLESVASERKFLGSTRAPPRASVRDFVLEHIARRQPQHVAELDGQLVGWADITPRGQDATRHIGTLGMGVHRELRGHGIGLALVLSVIDAAWRLQLKRIELEVFPDNAAAISLYEKLGFEHEGLMRMARLVDGHYRDVYRMALLHPDIHPRISDPDIRAPGEE